MTAPVESRGYVHGDVLVSTDWVADHLNDPGIRVVESNEDMLLYPSGHIPGAVQMDWTLDLNDQIRRDYLSREAFEALGSRIGITPDTTVVFYGDKNNWWAAYAFWVFQLFGHTPAKIMDGGRLKWEKEGRPMTREVPKYPATTYRARERQDGPYRAFRNEVLAHVRPRGQLVDVRSPEEYTGERMHMPDYPQGRRAARRPHPRREEHPVGPRDQSRRRHVQDRCRTGGDLLQEQALKPADSIIAYCRIGERSSHTWFVLKYLLGFANVRNYDGSWTEWGNLVGAPIEK